MYECIDISKVMIWRVGSGANISVMVELADMVVTPPVTVGPGLSLRSLTPVIVTHSGHCHSLRSLSLTPVIVTHSGHCHSLRSLSLTPVIVTHSGHCHSLRQWLCFVIGCSLCIPLLLWQHASTPLFHRCCTGNRPDGCTYCYREVELFNPTYYINLGHTFVHYFRRL